MISALAGVHLVVTLWHGQAHTALAIGLSPPKTAFVIVVIVIAPVIAALTLWTRNSTVGLWIFSLAMLGAFLFGLYHHYILVSPDNVAIVPHDVGDLRTQFVTSAAALAVTESAAAIYGVQVLIRLRGRIRSRTA